MHIQRGGKEKGRDNSLGGDFKACQLGWQTCQACQAPRRKYHPILEAQLNQTAKENAKIAAADLIFVHQTDKIVRFGV
jgi:hypothetical protein